MALGAAAAGTVILALTFSALWPLTQRTVLPRNLLIADGRQVAERFGLNVNEWKAYAVPSVSKQWRRSSASLSPLSVRITYVSKRDGRAAEVGLDSAGTPVYWRPPKNDRERKFESGEAAAKVAFAVLAGAKAANYSGPVRSMGEDAFEDEFVWKGPTASGSGLKDRIKVIVTSPDHTPVVKRAEHTDTQSSDEDEDFDQAGGGWRSGVLSGAFGVLCTAGVTAMIAIYILWWVRKAVNHKFSIRLAIAALALMTVVMLAGTDWEKSRSVNLDESLPIVPALFMAGAILCFTVVGRGISASARPKWMSLEQLCLLAPLGKPTGTSIAAGVLFSPLLVAVPFLVAGCGFFPRSWVLPRGAERLYSRAPLLDSIDVSSVIFMLGFFGFGVPVLERVFRQRWLRRSILLPIGTLFFADQTRTVAGQFSAVLAAGLFTLLIFWFLWAHFDLLAVLTLQLASAIALSVITLRQKGGDAWTLEAALAGLLLVAYWMHQRGQSTAQGDPLASIPALSGFRAEREKLKAEFSLARRAQQDMLPQTPPSIPGYSIAASCTPSLEVGGDLYDFLALTDGRIGIGVADVSGKGVPAALYMTLTKGLLASVTKDNTQLVPVVEEVNRHLHGVTRKKVFVTMALGFLDPERRVMHCVRAGHNPMVWRQTAQDLTTLVTPGGLGLGITASRVFATQLKVAELELAAGDAVVFYSDGITEAMNSELEQFGEQRLMDAVKRTDRLDAAETRDSILAEVRAFLDGVHPQDDMTLVVLRVGSAAELMPSVT